jgi:hypothetical protein
VQLLGRGPEAHCTAGCGAAGETAHQEWARATRPPAVADRHAKHCTVFLGKATADTATQMASGLVHTMHTPRPEVPQDRRVG